MTACPFLLHWITTFDKNFSFHFWKQWQQDKQSKYNNIRFHTHMKHRDRTCEHGTVKLYHAGSSIYKVDVRHTRRGAECCGFLKHNVNRLLLPSGNSVLEHLMPQRLPTWELTSRWICRKPAIINEREANSMPTTILCRGLKTTHNTLQTTFINL